MVGKGVGVNLHANTNLGFLHTVCWRIPSRQHIVVEVVGVILHANTNLGSPPTPTVCWRDPSRQHSVGEVVGGNRLANNNQGFLSTMGWRGPSRQHIVVEEVGMTLTITPTLTRVSSPLWVGEIRHTNTLWWRKLT